MLKPDELFIGYETALERFAKRYNLKIDKYHYDFPVWSFRGRHPKGGIVRIEFGFSQDRSAHIQRWWMLDDYDKCFRAYRCEVQEIDITPDRAMEVLRAQLFQILDWEFGTWTRKHKEFWRLSWRREDFIKAQNSYPEINLHADR